MHRQLAALTRLAEDKPLVFQEVIETLKRHYEFTPTAFVTGEGSPLRTENPAGTNNGSCLLLAAAKRLGLGEQAVLNLYGEHYSAVRQDPDGTAHPNIRAFMANGWAGVRFAGDPLRLKGPA